MPLADALANSTNQYRVKTHCHTCRFFKTITDEDREAIQDWMDAGKNLAELFRHCRDEGLDVDYRNFLAHFEKRHGVS